MKKKDNILAFSVVATDVVCFDMQDGELRTLIARAPVYSPFPGKWALVGGMVRPEEVAEDTVSRLLREKAGIKNLYAEQVHTFTDVGRDPRGRVVSIAYLALSNKDVQDVSKASLETKWVKVGDMPKLAYDHDQIFKTVFERLKFNIINTDIAKHLVSKEFTLSELQKVHEAVLGEGIDKRNFRKKQISLGFIKDLGKKKKSGVMRPAEMYMFKR